MSLMAGSVHFSALITGSLDRTVRRWGEAQHSTLKNSFDS